VNLEWRRLKAVVFESDDWGLCAWCPDDQAHRVLSDTPAFRAPAGRRYGASTLESAADVRALAQSLMEFRGGDGFPPVWQANTVMAAPDYPRLRPPLFPDADLPLVGLPDAPARWQRPGMWQETLEAIQLGVWWVELHGLHHLPEHAWLRALRRGEADARRAHEQQSPVCQAVEASGEYDPSEPAELRARHLAQAITRFEALVGRKPTSFCPPDYRWDETLETALARHGVGILQGKGEQMGTRYPRLQRLLHRWRYRHRAERPLYMPPRIAFEPCPASGGRAEQAVDAAHRAARRAWSSGEPAVISTHRVNFAHLQEGWSDAGRAALRALLARLSQDGAVFLTDLEIVELRERGWSLRAIGDRAVLLRYYGVPRELLRFPARPGATRVSVLEGRGPDGVEIEIAGGEVVARVHLGEYLLEWKSA
jgi:hypothetical protein